MFDTMYKNIRNIILILFISLNSQLSYARDLAEIQAEGVLRHIGIPYANFITVYKEKNKVIPGGLDVELMKGFAEYLGVKYEFIEANWSTAFTLLNGTTALSSNQQLDSKKFQGDVIANGATVLPWRMKIIDFSIDYFPSAVWLMARLDSDLIPITPTGSITQDIQLVKKLIKNHDVLALKKTCLDPDLYDLYDSEANIILPKVERKLNEMIPAIIKNDAESTLIDVPDALIALDQWAGHIKVIGPISENQVMAAGFRKSSPKLRESFNQYLLILKENGEYIRLVKKYYPSVFNFYPEYFLNEKQ